MNNLTNSTLGQSVEVDPTVAGKSAECPPRLTRGAERTQHGENCILYDWLTFSSPLFDLDSIKDFLGLFGMSGWVDNLPSRYHYAHRAQLNGIHIHYTPADNPGKYNPGVCVEFSGSGCRFFETVSQLDMQGLCDLLISSGFHVSRVDVAYDDFQGFIDLQQMAGQASRFEFTSRCQAREIVDSSKISDSKDSGLSIMHGSRSSHIFIRCYDKRYERSRFDLPHWVRLEIMLRDANAVGFLQASGSIGEKWAGVLNNYLAYRDPTEDTNKRRWPVSEWWKTLLSSAERLSVASRKDEDYNLNKFREFVYHHMSKTFYTALMVDGPVFVLSMLKQSVKSVDELSFKHQEIIRRFSHSDLDQIHRFLDFCSQFESELTADEKKLFDDINNDPDLEQQHQNALKLMNEKGTDFL